MESPKAGGMIGLLCFRSGRPGLAIQVEGCGLKLRNAELRHQLIVLRRRLHGRVRLTNHDRWFLIQLYRWFPSILQLVCAEKPRPGRSDDEVRRVSRAN